MPCPDIKVLSLVADSLVNRSHSCHTFGCDAFCSVQLCTAVLVQMVLTALHCGSASIHRCGNKAAIVDIDENMNHKIVQFDHAPPKGVTEVTRTVPEYFL